MAPEDAVVIGAPEVAGFICQTVSVFPDGQRAQSTQRNKIRGSVIIWPDVLRASSS